MISFRLLSALFLLKLKNQFGITSMTYSFKVLANIRSIQHRDTPACQNNYIKLSGFGFNKLDFCIGEMMSSINSR